MAPTTPPAARRSTRRRAFRRTPPTQFAPSLTTQVNAYLAANGGHADPNALYTVWGGANDLFFTSQRR